MWEETNFHLWRIFDKLKIGADVIMNILIGILGYILGFTSCILLVRILIAKKRNDEIINKANQIIEKEKQRQKFNKEHNLTVINNKKNKPDRDKLDE